MTERKRFVYLMLIMVVITLAVAGSVLGIQYNTSLEVQRDRLVETAQSRARMIEAVARYGRIYSQDYPEGPEQGTISQITEAHGNFRGFGETGEFTLARREGEYIVFILSQRYTKLTTPQSIRIDQELAEPMKLALSGESGSIIGVDYRGELVLAAYEPVKELDLGIVAKIDMTEVRAPFVTGALIAVGISWALVLLGVLLFRSISEPILARIARSEAQLKQAQALGKMGSWEFDNAINKLVWSDEIYRLYERDKALVAPSFAEEASYYPPEEAMRWRELPDYSIENGETSQGDFWVQLPSGRAAFYNTSIRPEKDATGRVVKLFGTLQDVTERKKVEQLKDEFIGMVSHELKTPLTIIMGSIQTAMSEGVPEEEATYLLKNAVSSSMYLADIIENLLDLSRAQANQLIMRKQSVAISEVASSVLENFTDRSDIHQFVLDIPAQLLAVMADRVRVVRIFNNLIENAVKYSPNGGTITVFAQQKDDCLVVGVKDQGIGISPADQTKLFQPFGRVGRTSSTQGVGIGLVVCSRLVEAQGGRMWLESEPGKGATFFFTIPLES